MLQKPVEGKTAVPLDLKQLCQNQNNRVFDQTPNRTPSMPPITITTAGITKLLDNLKDTQGFFAQMLFYNKCAISFWCSHCLLAMVDYGTDQGNDVMVAQFLFLFS